MRAAAAGVCAEQDDAGDAGHGGGERQLPLLRHEGALKYYII